MAGPGRSLSNVPTTALSWKRRCGELAGGDWRDSHVVLAVSGGADSVAMLRAMVALKELRRARASSSWHI